MDWEGCNYIFKIHKHLDKKDAMNMSENNRVPERGWKEEMEMKKMT